MRNLEFSNHATKRSQQRAIGREVIEKLHVYGEVVRDRHGAESIMLTNRALADMRSELGSKVYKKCESKKKAYLVVTDCGAVITVAHTRKRFRINWH
jgi:hypothetical protein